MRLRLKGINKVRKKLASGRFVSYYYHRATGIRIEGSPDSPKFVDSFYKIEAAQRSRLDGVLAGLFSKYTRSPEFQKLAVSTQTSYRRMLDKAELRFGTLPVVALNDPRIKRDLLEWRAEVAKTSGEREADHRLSAVSAAITWAVDNGHVTQNHIKGFKRLHHADRSEVIWTDDDISAFLNVAPASMRDALIIALHTGLRQGDIRKLAWSGYDGSSLTLRISKNTRNGVPAKPIRIPCTAKLKATLDDMDRTSTLILATKTGKAYQPRYFKKEFGDAMVLAGLTERGLHFNDLRGTAITRLAEAGCNTAQIVAITGHKLASAHVILERYLARTQRLGDDAITLLENMPATKSAN